MKRKGICSVCACIAEEACRGGCGWANVKQTLCTACAPLAPAERQERTQEALEDLVERQEQLLLEAMELNLRARVISS